ncbi:MAG: hypothetical protein IID44_11765 [Planctomycetes bacterium]|nr:hypothetical protein [Planctomycetota bacterium]
MARISRSGLVCSVTLSIIVGAVFVSARADEEKDATPKPVAKAPPMYPVPDGTADELFEFTKTLLKKKFDGESFDEYRENARKVRRSIGRLKGTQTQPLHSISRCVR